MRWLVGSTALFVVSVAFVAWAVVTHPASDPYNGPFEIVAQTSATQVTLTAQGGQVPPGGQVTITAEGSTFALTKSCFSLPCTTPISVGGLMQSQAQIKTASGQVVATATTGG